MSFDMRFGVRGKTCVNQMEVPLGILPGGTGTQRMPRLIGRNRAMEVIMGGIDMDADTAERWGYLNRAFERGKSGRMLNGSRNVSLRFRLRRCGSPSRRSNSADKPLAEGFRDESYLFQQLVRTDTRPAQHAQVPGGRRADPRRRTQDSGVERSAGRARRQDFQGVSAGQPQLY